MNVGTDRVYTPNDSQEVVEFFKDLEDGAHNVPKICTDVLANTSFWGENLTEYDSLLNAVEKSYSSIKTKGIEKALNEVVYG